MRNWLIKQLGGYLTPADALLAVESKEDKHKILTKTVSHLFKTIGDNDILKYEKGLYWYKGRELTEHEVKQIKSEAELFEKFFLYEVLNAEVKHHTARKMFYLSQTVDDLIAGKLIEYTWDIIKTKVKTLTKQG